MRLFNAPGQLGHVVSDIDRAMERWTSVLDAGPFFTFTEPVVRPARYRGRDVEVSFRMAFAYFGETQLEFIQPLDDTPSPYTDFLNAGGEGFHHLLYWVKAEDYAPAVARLIGAGFRKLFEVMPGSAYPPLYLDPPKPFGLLTEIAVPDPMRQRAYNEMRRITLTWDGADPIRVFKSREDMAAAIVGSGPRS